VLIRKKDGTWRFALDYRGLNAVTRTDVYPLPRVDDTIARLGGYKFFTTLDLMSGYWQMGMHENDIEKTAFKSQHGLWEWTKMPMGLKNAGASFQRMMNEVLAEHIGKICWVYLDDIIIFSSTFTEHMQHVEAVLGTLEKAGLTCKLVKCHFAQPQVEFLGHLLTPDGISSSTRLTQCVRECQAPTNKTELRAFLGLTNYYRDLIPHYSHIATPLTALTGKYTHFHWSTDCDTAFTQLKAALVNPPVLRHADFQQPFTLHTDASSLAIGGVLTQATEMHSEHPIRYMSRKLSTTQRKYAVGELECLSVIVCIRECKSYLAGTHFTLVTDHQPLLALLTRPSEHASARLTRWALELQQYDFTIRHRIGKYHVVPDAMSRSPVAQVFTTSATESLHYNILQQQHEDLHLSYVHDVLAGSLHDPPNTPEQIYLSKRLQHLSVRDGTLVFHRTTPQGQVTPLTVVGAPFRQNILRIFHNNQLEGNHSDVHRTHEKILQRYWWPYLHADVTTWVQSCPSCLAHRAKPHDRHTARHRVPAQHPWQSIHIDTISLPMSGGKYAHAFTVVDQFTRYAEAVAVESASAEAMAKWLITELIPRHGCPEIITSDRGPEFVNLVIKHLLKHMSVLHHIITAYRPQANGLVERFNRTLKHAIRRYSTLHQVSDWHSWLPFIVFAYNNTVHSSTHFTPFFLMHGRNAKLPIDVQCSYDDAPLPMNVADYVDKLRTTLRDAFETTTRTHEDEQIRRTWADPPTIDSTNPFREGQQVLVHTSHSRPGLHKIFSKTNTGPFTVLKVISPTHVVLDQDGRENIVPVSRLIPFSKETQLPSIQKSTPAPATPVMEVDEDEEGDSIPNGELEVAELVDREVRTSRSRTNPRRVFYRVRWKGYTVDDDTWEPLTALENCRQLVAQYDLRCPFR